jgi:ankyrin repeat protein
MKQKTPQAITNHTKPVELANKGEFHKINWSKLSVQDITEFDKNGFTLLHYAIRHGHWDSVPIKLKDKEFWQDAKDGTSIHLSACYGNDLDRIDTSQLTTDDLLKRNDKGDFLALHFTNKARLFTIPKDIITEKVLWQKVEDGYRATGGYPEDHLIHRIARFGQIGYVQQEYLSHKLLSLRSNAGETVFHILAKDEAQNIPQELWTRKALLYQNDSKVTPLHLITKNSGDLIPKDITINDLLMPDEEGNTPLYNWCLAPGTEWALIPNKYLTEETLESTGGPPKQTVLEKLLNRYIKEYPIPNRDDLNTLMNSKISYALKQTKTPKLNELLKEYKPPVTKLIKEEILRRKVKKEVKTIEESFDI